LVTSASLGDAAMITADATSQPAMTSQGRAVTPRAIDANMPVIPLETPTGRSPVDLVSASATT